MPIFYALIYFSGSLLVSVMIKQKLNTAPELLCCVYICELA
jgi:hypothetical protein